MYTSKNPLSSIKRCNCTLEFAYLESYNMLSNWFCFLFLREGEGARLCFNNQLSWELMKWELTHSWCEGIDLLSGSTHVTQTSHVRPHLQHFGLNFNLRFGWYKHPNHSKEAFCCFIFLFITCLLQQSVNSMRVGILVCSPMYPKILKDYCTQNCCTIYIFKSKS